MKEKANQASELIAQWLKAFDPEEFDSEYSAGRAESIADGLAVYLSDEGIL